MTHQGSIHCNSCQADFVTDGTNKNCIYCLSSNITHVPPLKPAAPTPEPLKQPAPPPSAPAIDLIAAKEGFGPREPYDWTKVVVTEADKHWYETPEIKRIIQESKVRLAASDASINHLLSLAHTLASYLAATPTERFKPKDGTPRKIEESFYRITAHLEGLLLPK